MLSSNQLRFLSQKWWKLLSEVFLKECKYIKKKVIRHINDNMSDFSSSDYSDNFDEELIKGMRLMFFE